MIERWLVAVRDHPERPPMSQRHVLHMLALRLDWATGRGFAGVRDLMADAGVSKNTVMRATTWATGSQLLQRTRRGHYISAQTVIASEWQLTQPGHPQAQSQGPSGGTLESQSPNGGNPRSQSGQPKVPVGTTHQESSTSKPSSLSRAFAAISAAVPDVTEREARQIINNLKNNPTVREPVPYLTAAIRKGDAAALVATARDQLNQADAMNRISGQGREKPPWCGRCDERTRLTIKITPRRCPNCHPLAGGP